MLVQLSLVHEVGAGDELIFTHHWQGDEVFLDIQGIRALKRARIAIAQSGPVAVVPTPFKNGTYRLHVGRGDGYGQVILTVGPDKASLRALQHPRMLEVDEVPHRLVPLQTVWAVIHYSLPDQYQDQRAAFKLQMAKAGCKPWKPLPGIYAYKGFPRSIPPPTTNYSGRGSDQWYFYHYTGTIAVLRRLTKSFERYAAVTNNRRKPSMTITVSTVDGTVIDSRPTSWDLDQPRRD